MGFVGSMMAAVVVHLYYRSTYRYYSVSLNHRFTQVTLPPITPLAGYRPA